MRSLGRRFILLLGMAFLSGCTGYRAPTIAIERVTLTEASDEAVALAFALDIHNPNAAPLDLFEFRYTLAVDGKQVYAGRRAPEATLRAMATQRVTLPAVIPFERAGWTPATRPAAARYALSGRVVYIVPSTFAKILFDSGVRRPGASFTRRGQFTFAPPAETPAETPAEPATLP